MVFFLTFEVQRYTFMSDLLTKEELASLLNGRQYGDEISSAECYKAKQSGLVVVYGASDDLMEFAGAIDEEVGAYEGTTVLIDEEGVIERPESDDWDDDRNEGKFYTYLTRKTRGQKITSIWNEGGYSWQYKTKIPHSTFEIMDDEDKYCKGIVFYLCELH